MLGLSSLIALSGCADDNGGDSEQARKLDGEALYNESQPDGNSFTCATCHALSEPAADGLRRPGHPIGDALRRSSFKNGEVTNPLDAVNSCLVEWMAADPWSAGSDEWQAFSGYLADQDDGEGDATSLSFTVVDPPADVSGGDAEAGHALFNESCSVCHGDDAVGTRQAPPLVGELLTADYIAERIRLSGSSQSAVYDGLTGGRMPFWSQERLSDEELLDLVAYVLISEGDREMNSGDGDTGDGDGEPGDGDGDAGDGDGDVGDGDAGDGDIGDGDAGDGDGDGDGDGGSDCLTTHEKVGQVAVLTTHFHGVSGTATILDDCTIELSDFVYDGQGIIVEAYGGLGGNYLDGFAMSGNLKRAEPYSGETLTLTLPEDKSLDDLDGVSIWCVDVAISFGDGMFQ